MLAKKTYVLILTVLLIMGWAPAAIAATTTSNTKELELDFKYYYMNYKEVDTDESFLDSETGWLNGFNLAYKIQIPNTQYYGQINYEITNHKTDYDGFTWGGVPAQGTTSNQIINVEILFTSPITLMPNSFLSFGLGFHRWYRDLLAIQKEEYSWFYIPIGYRWNKNINNKWEVALDITAKVMFKGQLTGIFSDYDIVRVDLGSKPGLKIDLPLTYKLNSNWAMTIKPWYEYSSIGQSNWVLLTQDGIPVASVSEPDSTTHRHGIDFGVKYVY